VNLTADSEAYNPDGWDENYPSLMPGASYSQLRAMGITGALTDDGNNRTLTYRGNNWYNSLVLGGGAANTLSNIEVTTGTLHPYNAASMGSMNVIFSNADDSRLYLVAYDQVDADSGSRVPTDWALSNNMSGNGIVWVEDGDGTYKLTTSGTISPGASVGKIKVWGDLEFAAGSKLVIEMEDPNGVGGVDGWDQVEVMDTWSDVGAGPLYDLKVRNPGDLGSMDVYVNKAIVPVQQAAPNDHLWDVAGTFAVVTGDTAPTGNTDMSGVSVEWDKVLQDLGESPAAGYGYEGDLAVSGNDVVIQNLQFVGLPGDGDLDGDVDFDDFSTLAFNFGTSAAIGVDRWIVGDYDWDGDVDFDDFSDLAFNFGKTYAGAPGAAGSPQVPEPATLGLLALGIGGLFMRIRKRRKGATALLVLVAVCGLAVSGAQADMLVLDVQLDTVALTWQVTGELKADDGVGAPTSAGLALFKLDVVGEDGVNVLTSKMEAPKTIDTGFNPMGFGLFASDGAAGLGIAASQPFIYDGTNDPAKDALVFQDVCITAGASTTPPALVPVSWAFPCVLASGTYDANVPLGKVRATGYVGNTGVLIPAASPWEGPGNIEPVSAVEGDVEIVPEPATMALLGVGFAGLAVLRRRRR
jgi:hypothetical protein